MHIFFVAFNHRQHQLLEGLETREVGKNINVIDNLNAEKDMVNMGQTKEE
jgi:hypothetical protein